MRARVTVYPRREILDPQGKAIHEALERIGFSEISEVRSGKSFEIEIEGDDSAAVRRRLEEMCRRLLANPVVEEYAIALDGEGGA